MMEGGRKEGGGVRNIEEDRIKMEERMGGLDL